MDDMGQRISKCIVTSGLTKTDFAKKLNISQSYVSRLASGEKMPSDRTISDICRLFGISESWLRTGEGDAEIKLDEDEEFDRLCKDIQLSNDGFIKDILRRYWKLSATDKEVIRQMLSCLPEK